MSATVVIEALSAHCAGCEVAILDQGELLLDILERISIVHAPILMDSKYRDPAGDSDVVSIPRADVGILSGGIRTEHGLAVAKAVRESCGILIANGSCACMGGIPSLANLVPPDVLKQGVPNLEHGVEDGDFELPPLTARVAAVNEVVPVDIFLPGCPPPTHLFAAALQAVLEGKSFDLPEDTVCNECSKVKEKRTVFADNGLQFPEMLRPLETPPLDKRCLIEQGFFCMGAATRSGCGARCTQVNMPCRGCMGPKRIGENPRAEMLGALSVYNYALRDVHDRRAAFNWFTGGHSNLRPVR
ncbi:MAG TPA: methyl viologen-reducing hydrogenase [Syntrophobacter fumaroxidans]|nr:methyl viologen-reducing hydrogenase [Syntrophobacter fumaroxidans]